MSKSRNSGRPSRFISMSDREIFSEAQRLMKQEKRYLDPSLIMETLAAEMGVHRNNLSRAVNRFAGTHFNEWLGAYRLDEVDRLAAADPQETLTRLAKRAGFPSRSSFYRMFIKIRHTPPLEWFTREGNARQKTK